MRMLVSVKYQNYQNGAVSNQLTVSGRGASYWRWQRIWWICCWVIEGAHCTVYTGIRQSLIMSLQKVGHLLNWSVQIRRNLYFSLLLTGPRRYFHSAHQESESIERFIEDQTSSPLHRGPGFLADHHCMIWLVPHPIPPPPLPAVKSTCDTQETEKERQLSDGRVE